ncbi:hypothetical protein SEA_PUPPER_5 [Gordonia phage Pupper]|uniref:Uncharacterized protein n=1 Tax=Gordonia phage Pupper TaxID=2571249 RepID=A0A4Y6EJ41_9CAUD|nr:hypothetical protein KHQ83_gp005 [Gordonia phage Pupper]QDF18492.1 hypothetical protein SEA_PUPPER_5 [Gordonia phage Pupper]QDF18725.1 hypothetical protein SEA_SCENTAE_5 [Gordonia phage SCentae]
MSDRWPYGEIPAHLRIVDRWSSRHNAFRLELQQHGPTRRTISTRRQLYGWRTIHTVPDAITLIPHQRNYLLSYVQALMTPPRRYDEYIPPVPPRPALSDDACARWRFDEVFGQPEDKETP